MLVKGEKIRLLREENGLTLTDLSEKAGLSVSYISEIERGSKKPSLKTLDKIAAAFRIPRSQLVDINETSPGISMGEKIRLVREKNTLSLVELAKKIGISATYLSDIERGVVCPAINTIKKIAAALEIPATSLMSHESSVGYKLRMVREEMGLTQMQLAQEAGLSAGLIGQIEHGRVQPSLKTLEKIANAMGISACFFVVDQDGVDDMLPAMGIEFRQLLQNPQVQSVLRMVCHMNKEELQFVMNFIQLFKKAEITNFKTD